MTFVLFYCYNKTTVFIYLIKLYLRWIHIVFVSLIKLYHILRLAFCLFQMYTCYVWRQKRYSFIVQKWKTVTPVSKSTNVRWRLPEPLWGAEDSEGSGRSLPYKGSDRQITRPSALVCFCWQKNARTKHAFPLCPFKQNWHPPLRPPKDAFWNNN